MDGNVHNHAIDRLASWVFYLAALLAVATAVLAGLSVANASSAIPAATIGFQSPLFKPFWDMIVSSFRVAGGLIVVSGLLVAALLVAFGLMLARARALTTRVERLERALATVIPGVTVVPEQDARGMDAAQPTTETDTLHENRSRVA
jgi:hypothetical protein